MPLQKSYSEQRDYKHRSSWQRSHSHPVNLDTPKSRPLLPISDATKNKLNKFQYQPRHDGEVNPQPAAGCHGPGQDENTDVFVKENTTKSTATPVTRLSWQDLMEPGVPAEDETQISPNDRLMWNNKQDSLHISALSPMMSRRGKKRARSSSPVSSPSDKPTTPVVNVEKLTKALRSPHADPTLALWDRYSLNHAGDPGAPSEIMNPALAHLIASSSPKPLKPSKTAEGRSNLRRALSGGLNGSKKRKIEKSKSGSQTSGEQKDLEAASKSSLVTALLDTVTSSIQDRSPDGATPPRGRHSQSPTKSGQHASKIDSVSQDQRVVTPDSISSDYGDEDFDEDTFMQLEAALDTHPATAVIGANSTLSASKCSEPAKHPPTTTDEFDYLHDDVFDEAESFGPRATSNAQTGAIPSNPATNGAESCIYIDDGDDEFGDDLIGDVELEAMELAATQAEKENRHASTNSGKTKKTIQRYLVTNVLDGKFADEHGHDHPEKVLLIQADGSKVTRTVHLRGAWYDTPAHADSYVHVIGQFSPKGQCIVDDARNLLILHPDQLISATVVADSFGCLRRAVLQDRVKATSEASAPLVYGTILHEVFQEALLANQWDLAFLSRVITNITEKHMEDLYTIKVGLAAAREHLQSKMTELSYWAKAFVSSQPNADAIIEDRNGKKANLAITKLLDVEEHVWSPMYGLKGNIDATVEVVMTDGKDRRTLTVPFEVKTGKHANSSHMAQTALYTLLLSDRYDIDISYGILYYMESSKTLRIPAIRHELRHMIMQRNELACHVRERSVQLPPMLKSKHMCGKCYAKTSCFVYHRLADDGDGESSGMHEKFDELIDHLTPIHQEFFIKWETLLTKEEKESKKTKRELWTMTSVEREKKSRCFADVIIEEGSSSIDTDNPRINRYHYTFIKRVKTPGFSFLESELNVGEPIVVSDEQGHFALAIGYVTHVRKQRISVAVDRRLHNARIRQPGFNEVNNQVFASIMEVAPEGSTPAEAQGRIKDEPVRYRLDQDEFSNGMATVRNNLVQMMANNVVEASQLRRLIVDLEAPRFKSIPTPYTIQDQESLNVDQHKAIEKVMSAQDYALVLGMPGTGKTFTIAHIIRTLTAQGKSVLLTSHTHTAVDNIILKLKSDRIPILRLGAPAKVHPEVQEFAILAGHPMKSFDEIKHAWHDTPVVATTCLGINHPVFLERAFDYCIVDEASQITLPICAGPIRMARTFVLVGDHNQLPPVVKNEEARMGGLDVSLFKLLSDSHPESVVNLAHQYRMCEDIMTLSNTLIYKGQLRCGTEDLRFRKLHVPNIAGLKQRHYDASTVLHPGTPRSICAGPSQSRCWLQDLIDSEARVRFINTDTIEPIVREEAHGKRIVNAAEVNIVSQLVDSLLAVGVPENEIGVMTHYRAQLFLLKEKLKIHAGVEMHTTDRFQGRDKEVIVLSLVRSNEACNIGDLLKDWRRINVAFTRAKTKLLVIGSLKTLKDSGSENMLSRFITLMEERNWIYDMPADALTSHHFEDFGTQITATATATQKTRSPKKAGLKAPLNSGDKENWRPSPKRTRISEKALLQGKLITRDILNEMTNGAF